MAAFPRPLTLCRDIGGSLDCFLIRRVSIITVKPIARPINGSVVRFYCTAVDGVKGCCLDGEKRDGSDVSSAVVFLDSIGIFLSGSQRRREGVGRH